MATSLLPPLPPHSHSGAMMFLRLGGSDILFPEIHSPRAQSLAFKSLLISHLSLLAPPHLHIQVVPASTLAIPIYLPI